MSYRKDIKAAWERVHAVPSHTFESSLGPVEYALEGGNVGSNQETRPA